MASMNDVQLTPNDILKKQFRSKMKGYDQDEVDSYLDTIIGDYQTFVSIIENLQNQISELKSELSQAQEDANKVSQVDDDMKTYHPSNSSYNSSNLYHNENENSEITTNVAMLQRISTLERKVYNLEQRMNAQDRTYQAN
ncbi:DivIVA domain-containing protein [uncultured Lactobacillus sp.]|uniref:DivIVA domain-containing protein n=1 Tax=uncultured Lactobacillus sp. TaxID=153152 RepID=UPI0026162E7F|nr:DivIVA domain-containing protein [uncultured Lactobacillus sp.]